MDLPGKDIPADDEALNFVGSFYFMDLPGKDIPADDEALNFVGSFINLGDFSVTEHPLHVEFFHVAVATKELDAFCGDFHGR